jgi:hypothetical protein
MHTEWPCYTGLKRGCRAEAPLRNSGQAGATLKAKPTRRGKSRSLVAALLVMTPKDTAPGPPTERHVAAPWATRAFGTAHPARLRGGRRHEPTRTSEEQRRGGIPLAPEERSGANGAPDSALGMTVRGSGVEQKHQDYPLSSGAGRRYPRWIRRGTDFVVKRNVTARRSLQQDFVAKTNFAARGAL